MQSRHEQWTILVSRTRVYKARWTRAESPRRNPTTISSTRRWASKRGIIIRYNSFVFFVRRRAILRRPRVSPRDTSYKYISFGYLLLLVTLWKVEFSETQRQGLLWLGIQPDNSNSKTCSAWPVLPSVSENPLTSRWRENLHNRSGYVPNVEQRGSLCPLPGPFCMFTKKSDPLPLYAVRHHPPYPSTFLAPYFLITYIYIFFLHPFFFSFFFFFLSRSRICLLPSLCFSLFFSCSLIDRITYSLTRLFTPDFYLFSNIG